jgi:serine/threonine protein kinase
LYLLQEYLEGETLADWAKKNKRPPVQTVTAFATQIVKGLRALHRRETLHQDLKPDNIFLCSDGTIKLIDLGAASVAGLDEGQRRDRPGAAEYAAPEYALNLPRDTRADQFSLAITLYELLTGEHPYGETFARADSPADFQKLRYVSACRFNPHVPLWLDAALKKGCSLLMDDRYEALGDFLTDLESPNPMLAPVNARPLAGARPCWILARDGAAAVVGGPCGARRDYFSVALTVSPSYPSHPPTVASSLLKRQGRPVFTCRRQSPDKAAYVSFESQCYNRRRSRDSRTFPLVFAVYRTRHEAHAPSFRRDCAAAAGRCSLLCLCSQSPCAG